MLENYDFPGNVRELHNLLERAMVLTSALDDDLRLDLEPGRSSMPSSMPPASSLRARAGAAGFGFPGADDEVLSEVSMRELERRNLLRALERCEFRIAGERGAAKLLGLSPSTLAYRMKQLGIERPR
jgi:transcriptional regulator with GAF, ATPase, and Fis domain